MVGSPHMNPRALSGLPDLGVRTIRKFIFCFPFLFLVESAKSGEIQPYWDKRKRHE
jgi:hypothetical protein